MSELDGHKWDDEEKCLAAPDQVGYRMSDRQDADDALEQAVLCCPNTSREVFFEAMMELVGRWVAEGNGLDEPLAEVIFDEAMRHARRKIEGHDD